MSGSKGVVFPYSIPLKGLNGFNLETLTHGGPVETKIFGEYVVPTHIPAHRSVAEPIGTRHLPNAA